MTYLTGILLSLVTGFLLIRLLTAGRLGIILHVLLALALGLGIDGTAGFYTHILLGQFNRFLPVGLVVLAILILFIMPILEPARTGSKSRRPSSLQSVFKSIGERLPGAWQSFLKEISSSLKIIPRKNTVIGLLALGLLAVPLAISTHYYPLGGWDAWSCWNLKAKFIFLGQENWKDMLSPGLWRSNTQYPLLWPLINVWFWDLGGRFDQAIPMLNSVVIALLTAGVLLFGLLELKRDLVSSVSSAVLVTALPFGITLYTSQYSDSLLGLFFLSAFVCMLLAEKYGLPKLKILSMLFLGMMSFTKNEGLVAATCAALCILWNYRTKKKELKPLILAFLIAVLPTLIFTLFFAPKNEAFINGLTSTEKPINWARLSVIAVYPWFELISGKWNGFWLLTLGGMLLAGKKLWRSTLGVIGLSLGLYLGVVMAYYAVNTFFEISWWLSTTLSRIIFALIPTIVLWIAVGLENKPTAA